jgi:phosphate transport system substrate-binding protein
MFKNLKYSVIKITLSIVFIFIISCKDSPKDPKDLKETIIQGTATFFVDETIQSIIEDVMSVFESQYKAKITLVNKPESEIINLLLSQKAKVAILSRTLTPEESKIFGNKKIVPKITKFATDAIVLITNNSSKDTIVDLQDVINLMQGKPSKIKKLVFENPNSSTVRYMNNLASVTSAEKKGIYSVKSHEEVLQYISENKDAIGVVGLNLIVQSKLEWQKYIDKITVMGIKNSRSKPNNVLYYKPNQTNLAEGLYPLQRDLYMLNYQGSAGLGMGFASFIAGEIGQRIILKSGLLPVRIPARNINIHKEIMNDK